jgi:spore maturation protein CgeB
MNLFVFGSSITSSYWNGAATYYRGIYRNLHDRGFRITFAEPDIYKRQQNRDLTDVPYADVVALAPTTTCWKRKSSVAAPNARA